MRSTRTRPERGVTGVRFALIAAALLRIACRPGRRCHRRQRRPAGDFERQRQKAVEEPQEAGRRARGRAESNDPDDAAAERCRGGVLMGSYPNPSIETGALQGTDLGSVVSGSTDAASIAAGTCVGFANINFAEADEGDMILAVPTGAAGNVPTANFDQFGEIVLLGIPHPGEGHIKACNVSGGAIDPRIRPGRRCSSRADPKGQPRSGGPAGSLRPARWLRRPLGSAPLWTRSGALDEKWHFEIGRRNGRYRPV